MIENEGRTQLADGGCRITLGPCGLEDRLLVQIIPCKMFIDIAQNRIAFQKGRQAVARAGHLEAGVDRVRKITRIPNLVARGHAGSIGRGEGWEQRMGIGKAHTLRQ